MGPSLTDIPRRLNASDETEFEDQMVQKVLRNVDGRRDLKRIAVTCGLSDDAVLIIADDLIQNGLIEIGDSSRIENLDGRRRGRSSGMYSQVTPSSRPRRNSETGKAGGRPVVPDARWVEIEEAYAKLETQNYYALLGVPEDAPKSEIRHAYFRLSKRFHPDSLFGVELGSLRPKMEAVFQLLTDAYDTLGRSKLRARYNRDQGITATPRSEPMSEQPTTQHISPAQTGASSDAPTAAFKRLSDEEKAARRQLHSRKLLAVTQQGGGRYRLSSRPLNPAIEAVTPGPRDASSQSSPAPRRSAPHSLLPKQEISQATRDLARSLKQTAEKTGGISRAEAYFEDAKRSAADGDYRGAVNAARLAMNADPSREDTRQAFATYNAKLQESRAEVAQKRAESAEQADDWDTAAAAWKECCDAATNDLNAHLRAVRAGLQAGSDLAICKRLAQRAVEIDPAHVEARRWLAKVFVAAGMKLNAKRELKKALTQDPNDKISEDMLRTLG